MKITNRQKGITLIALVITIIILLILAGVAISSLTNNGLFGASKQAQEKYEIQSDIETLKLEYQEYMIAMVQDKLNITFLEYLEQKNYIVDYDSSEVVLNGRIYYIEKEPIFRVEYVGDADETLALLPVITNLETNVSDNQAIVTIALKDLTGVTITYSISKEGNIIKTKETTDLSYTFSELETGTTYIITVEATNEYGTRRRKVTVKTMSLLEVTNGKAYFEINPSEGACEKVTAKIVSEYTDSKATLQYRIGQDGTWTDYNGEFDVNKNTTIYGRYYNKTTEEIGYAFTFKIQIIDETGPEISINTEEIKGKTIKISVTAIDTGIGMPDTIEYKYYISTDGDNYTLEDTNNSNVYTYTNLSEKTTYYLKVVIADKLDNEGYGIVTETTTTTILVSNIDLNAETVTLLTSSPTKKLIAAVSPNNADDKKLIWTSSNINVATVSSDGLVTMVGSGETTITCTSSDGGATADCKVYAINGTAIYTISDLQGMSDMSGDYVVMNDIDASDYTFTTINKTFTGTIDGQGHKISNLTISGIGIFKTLQGAKISNLIIENVSVIPTDNGHGTFAMNSAGTSFEKVGITGIIGSTDLDYRLGGSFYGKSLVGDNSVTTFEDCYARTSLVTKYTSAYDGGGFVGYYGCYASLTRCYWYGTSYYGKRTGSFFGNSSNKNTTTSWTAVGSCTNCFYNKNLFEVSIPTSTKISGTGLTTDEFGNQSTFVNAEWDFQTTEDDLDYDWYMYTDSNGNSYPELHFIK